MISDDQSADDAPKSSDAPSPPTAREAARRPSRARKHLPTDDQHSDGPPGEAEGAKGPSLVRSMMRRREMGVPPPTPEGEAQAGIEAPALAKPKRGLFAAILGTLGIGRKPVEPEEPEESEPALTTEDMRNRLRLDQQDEWCEKKERVFAPLPMAGAAASRQPADEDEIAEDAAAPAQAPNAKDGDDDGDGDGEGGGGAAPPPAPRKRKLDRGIARDLFGIGGGNSAGDGGESSAGGRGGEHGSGGGGSRGDGVAFTGDAVARPVGHVATRAFAAFEWMIARRYLRARRKEGFISVIAGFSLLGISLGVATLIIVMSVMNGFRDELISRILGVNGHLTVQSTMEGFQDFDAVAQRLRALDGVTRAAPIIEGQLMASSANANSGAVVRGLRRKDLLTLKAVAEPEEKYGSLDQFDGGRGVAIGIGLANALHLRVGDKINLISPRGAVTPFGVAPRIKAYKVLYVFKVGMSEYDRSFIYMPLKEAQLYFNKPGQVDSIEVMVANPSEAATYYAPVRKAAGEPVRIYDWQRANASFIGALATERNVMFLILTLIILVAALNIISGLIMLVKDKSSDIAILRTMGMTRASVMRIFFICGSSIGTVGAVVGVALGVVFCQNITVIQHAVESITGPVFPGDVYYLSQLPAKLHASDVAMSAGIALALSFLATLYPSWRAARLDPVEALRYE